MKIHFSASRHDTAQKSHAELKKLYGQHDIKEADYVVALGGDGHMLEVLHRMLKRMPDHNLPVFGMNFGRLGYLMNEYRLEGLVERIGKAEEAPIHPLRMRATGANGKTHKALAINEVALLRQTQAAAHIEVHVDDKLRLGELIADGILLATPVGSTAYNLSAQGPVIPIGSNLLALTPISPFRPRRWRGALLRSGAKVVLRVLHDDFRSVRASADSAEFVDVSRVEIEQASEITLRLLHDAGQSLGERSIDEQFRT